MRTDADGTAIVPWAPREKLQYVEVDILGSDWKVDETDLKQIAAGITTVHARRERTVQGRLIMPDGADAQGILVTGFGFGPANNGDIPYARARRDGTFQSSRALRAWLCAGDRGSQVGQRPLDGHDSRQGFGQARGDYDEGLSRDALDGTGDARAAARAGRQCLGGARRHGGRQLDRQHRQEAFGNSRRSNLVDDRCRWRGTGGRG